MQIRVGWVALAAFVGACSGELFEASRYFNETVDLMGANGVVVDFPVSIRVRGTSGSDLTVTGTLTVSTSSAPRSQELADRLEIRTNIQGSTAEVLLAATGEGAGTFFPEATFGGLLDVGVPDDLDLAIIERGGSTEVTGMDGDIDIRSLGAVRVEDAAGDLRIRCDNGPVLVFTDVRPGSTTDVGVVQGETQLRLPANLNAEILAQTGGGQVFLQHPSLPPGRSDPYQQVIGQGGASVRVDVGRGNIVLGIR